MPYIYAILCILIGGFVFRNALIALAGVIVVLFAIGSATFISFGASVLLFSRIDAVVAGGSGWIEIPASIVLWIMAFSSILAFLLPKGSEAKSKVRKIGGEP